MTRRPTLLISLEIQPQMFDLIARAEPGRHAAILDHLTDGTPTNLTRHIWAPHPSTSLPLVTSGGTAPRLHGRAAIRRYGYRRLMPGTRHTPHPTPRQRVSVPCRIMVRGFLGTEDGMGEYRADGATARTNAASAGFGAADGAAS
ncbi:hypothetical protein GCM10023205_49750 [Yinghuangia aomiensis]|uniref:Uncharacterized protein n=1 Tax=Yinghuangia aomiensis TaxID=676205 RepID=A0ABP9HRS4_9ACTN